MLNSKWKHYRLRKVSKGIAWSSLSIRSSLGVSGQGISEDKAMSAFSAFSLSPLSPPPESPENFSALFKNRPLAQMRHFTTFAFPFMFINLLILRGITLIAYDY